MESNVPEKEGLAEDVVVVDAVFDGLHVGLPACGAGLEVDVGICSIVSGDINDRAVDR